jgi:hypothetical protein
MSIQFLGSYTTWMSAMAFQRYVLAPSSGLKYVGWASFCAYIGICFKKSHGGGVGVGALPQPTETVDRESCARETPTTILPHWPFFFLQSINLYIHRNSPTLHTLTLKMEAVYTPEMSATLTTST